MGGVTVELSSDESLELSSEESLEELLELSSEESPDETSELSSEELSVVSELFSEESFELSMLSELSVWLARNARFQRYSERSRDQHRC